MRKDHQADRLIAIRLRYCINTHLEDQGLTAPAQIGAAVGMPATEAMRQWRDGDVAALQAVAGRLGLAVPLEGLGLSVGQGREL